MTGALELFQWRRSRWSRPLYDSTDPSPANRHPVFLSGGISRRSRSAAPHFPRRDTFLPSSLHGTLRESSIVSLNEADRLPRDVILARARIIERLRGMSVPETRDSMFAMPLDNAIRHGTTTQNVKPRGLTSLEIDLLPSEIVVSDNPPRSPDCSICQESFSHGDKLVNLPCNHCYHFICLKPWVLSCGDCPNCRSIIQVVGEK